MRIEKWVEISQMVEIDVSPDQMAVILAEPGDDREETHAMIGSNLSTCIAYLEGLPAEKAWQFGPGISQRHRKPPRDNITEI